MSTFAAAFAALHAAHGVGDQWAQTSAQSCDKGSPGWAGRRACAGHVASYTAVGGVALAAVAAVAGVRLRPGRVAAGLAFSAVTHYVLDRREPLRALARRAGKADYLAWGTVVRKAGEKQEEAGPGTAPFHLDQSAHTACLFIAALIIGGRS